MDLQKFELRRDIVDYEPERGGFGKEYKDSEITELYLSCQCGSEILKIEKFTGEEEIYLSVFKYSLDDTPLLKRLPLMWDILNGRRINTADVILSKENFEKLKNFGNEQGNIKI